jgi:hypothetical protein
MNFNFSSSLILRQISLPSASPNKISRRIRSTGVSESGTFWLSTSKILIASSPERAGRTSNPSKLRRAVIISTVSFSSSTTKILLLASLSFILIPKYSTHYDCFN